MSVKKLLPAFLLLFAMSAMFGFGVAWWAQGASEAAPAEGPSGALFDARGVGFLPSKAAHLLAASSRNLTTRPGEELAPRDFFADSLDDTYLVSFEFLEEPDFFATNTQTVRLLVTDVFGNSDVFEAELTVLGNYEPPVIVGAKDMEVMLGSPIMFRAGVSAYDFFGRPIDFGIDNSAVDAWQLGAHDVVYYAYDDWGNRAEAKVVLHIIGVSPEYVYELVDGIFEEILAEGMTQVEQARAIFDWVSVSIRFTSDIGHESVYEAAHAAITRRTGNCFVFFGITHVMLTRAGIPSMRIDRVPGMTATNHRWNLVNPDGLGWFHLDATPSGIDIDRFMFTSSQAREFSALLERRLGRPYYYYYDPSLYPEIVQ